MTTEERESKSAQWRTDNLGKNVDLANVSNSVECPECMEKVEQEELDMFGGLCENCTT